MSRKTTTLFWLCLLCLFPLLSTAQSLSRFDYWIDDNIGDMQTKSLSGTSAEIIEELDLSALPMGVHKVCFRVVQTDGYQSAVNHLLFFKGIMGNGGTLEYWFDDQYDQRLSTPFDAGNGEMQELTLDLRNNTTFPMGFHKLNLRVIINGKASAVYTSHVLKLQAGSPNQLEYWIDGNYETVKTIEGQLSADGSVYVFTNDLDLSDVAPGYHRLFCRAVSSSRRTVTAVVSTPVIVKSRYNQDGSKAVLVSYDVSVDGGEAVTIPFEQKKKENEIHYTLDAINLTEGSHEVKVSVANSLGMTAAVSGKFTMKKPAKPTLTLTATEKDGKVSLRCNSAPRDDRSWIVRVDANGAKKVIYKLNESVYPTTITYTDLPTAAGAYTYFVKTRYGIAGDAFEEVLSNEVKVNVAKSAVESFGYLIGTVRYDGKYRKGYQSTIHFSDNDEEVVTSDGKFRRENIPVGTTITATLVGDKDYEAQPVTVTIGKDKNTIRIEAVRNYDYEEDAGTYDLMFADNVVFEPGKYLKVKVKRNQPKVWNGRLRLCVIEKDKDFMHEGYSSPIELVARQAYGLDENYFMVESERSFQLASSTQVEEVTFPLTDLKVSSGESKEYNFHVLSLGNTGPARWVMPNPAYASASKNPLQYQLTESGNHILSDDDIHMMVNVLTFLTGKVEGVSGYVGGVTVNRGSGVTGQVENLSKFIDGTSALKYLTFDAYARLVLSKTSMAEFLEDGKLQELSNILDQYKNSFTSVLDEYQQDIHNELTLAGTHSRALEWMKDAVNCLDMLKAYRTISEMRDFFSCAEAIVGLSGLAYAPLIQSYLDLGRAAISAIKTISWNYNAPYLPTDFYHKKVGIKVNIYAKNGYRSVVPKDGCYYVEKIIVTGKNNTEWMTATYNGYENVIVGANVFKQQTYDGPAPGANGQIEEFKPFTELWAEVYWRNGRITRVPLNPNLNGIEYDRPDFVLNFQSQSSDSENLTDLIMLKP